MKHLLFGVVAALLPFAVACSGSSNDALTLNIGIVQSDTGAAAVYGKTTVNGIELAIKQLESDDLKIEYTVIDDKSTIEGGNAAFATLSGQKVDAIIGPTLSGVALESHKISQTASIPTIGATTTGEGITDTGNFIFRTALPEAKVVPPVIQYAHSRSPIRAAVLVVDSSDGFSLTSATAMKQGLQAIGGRVVAEIDMATTIDMPGRLLELREGEPFEAFLVTPLVEKSASAMRTIRNLGFRQQLIGGNSFNTLDIIAASNGSVDGAYVGASWNPSVDTAASRKFVDDYTAAYGAAPDLYAAQGYAAVQVLVAAAKAAGSVEADALRSALASLSGAETIFGSIAMSGSREAQYEPVIQQFRGNRLEVVQ